MLKSKFKGKKLIELETKLSEYKGDDEIISSKEMAEIIKSEPKANFSHSTGIQLMDNILENVEAGELIVITGPTGHGKTSLLMTITKNMANNDLKSVWFSFELTPRQFFAKFNYNPPLFYLPKQNTDNTIFWLEERILEAIVKYDIKTVYIDDLHHIFSLVRVQSNTSLEIGDIIAKLKDIAVTNNITIFLQVHIKDPQDGTTREPAIRDIRDSGLIKALADTVIGIWRVPNDTVTEKGRREKMTDIEEDDTKSKVRIWKNRRVGKLSTFYLDMKIDEEIKKIDKELEKINGHIWEMAYKLERETDFEELKSWRIGRLKQMYTKRLDAYNRSKAQAEPYIKRKIITSQMSMIEQMVKETKEAKRNHFADWLEAGDLNEIEIKGLKFFLQANYLRLCQ